MQLERGANWRMDVGRGLGSRRTCGVAKGPDSAEQVCGADGGTAGAAVASGVWGLTRGRGG